ncbi:MAG: NfeD family protein [Lachnospiraceae bacterium]|nr:NfeD family protein [Lachnospiraceae bacterium]
MQYIWLAFVILFVVAEGMTVGLVSIWFAGGSLVAMLLAMAGAGIGWQMLAFLIVSAGLLIATRPLAKKYINSKKEKTNYKSVIGEVAKVTATIDNYNQTGAAFADGKEWTARATEDTVIIKKDTLVKVVAIEGVKLIVEPYKRTEEQAAE